MLGRSSLPAQRFDLFGIAVWRDPVAVLAGSSIRPHRPNDRIVLGANHGGGKCVLVAIRAVGLEGVRTH